MRNLGEMPFIDHKTENVAQKHQKEEKDFQQEKKEEGISRRDFIVKGAKWGLGLALGKKLFDLGVKKIDEHSNNSLNNQENKTEDPIDEYLSSIGQDLESIEEKLKVDNIDKKYADELSDKLSKWKIDFKLLKEQVEINQPFIDKMEKLGREVSLEKLSLDQKFLLGA